MDLCSSHVRNLGPLAALLNPQRKEEGGASSSSRFTIGIKVRDSAWKRREGGETWVVVSQNFQVAAMDLARLELRSERERLDASLSCCVGAALSLSLSS